MGEIRLSQQIFYYLLEHHELKEEEEQRLYRAYTEEEAIQNLVKSQAECNLSYPKRRECILRVFESKIKGNIMQVRRNR